MRVLHAGLAAALLSASGSGLKSQNVEVAPGALGAGESALTCEGKAPGPLGRPLLFKIGLLQVDRAEVTVVDESRARECKCTYVLGGLFDHSKGVVPRQSVNLYKRRCDSSCEADVVEHLNHDITVTQYLVRNERYAVPFVGARIANCDTFSLDLKRLLPMELQRIDALDVHDSVKLRLKEMKLDASSNE